MKEQHHYILTWDSEIGWFLNEVLAQTVFEGIAVDVIPEPFSTEEEAMEFIGRIESAGIKESLMETGMRLEEQLNNAITWINDIPLFLPKEEG
jgi:hypothetical protein